jgi:hypothetical protein
VKKKTRKEAQEVHLRQPQDGWVISLAIAVPLVVEAGVVSPTLVEALPFCEPSSSPAHPALALAMRLAACPALAETHPVLFRFGSLPNRNAVDELTEGRRCR